MLEILTTTADGTPEGKTTQSTREAISMALNLITHYQSNRTLFVILAVSLCAAFLAIEVLQWSWLPLIGLVFILPAILISNWLNSFQFERWKK